MNKSVNNFFTILYNNLKKKICLKFLLNYNYYLYNLFLIIYFYHTGNIIKQELIIQKTYNIKYYKLISLDLEKYPYIIFIFKSIHSYLLLLLNHILNTIYTHL